MSSARAEISGTHVQQSSFKTCASTSKSSMLDTALSMSRRRRSVYRNTMESRARTCGLLSPCRCAMTDGRFLRCQAEKSADGMFTMRIPARAQMREFFFAGTTPCNMKVSVRIEKEKGGHAESHNHAPALRHAIPKDTIKLHSFRPFVNTKIGVAFTSAPRRGRSTIDR